MATDPLPVTRTVILKRAGRGYADGYWDALVGVKVKMPALVDGGRVLVGYLVGVEEDADAFVLTFSDLESEG